MVVSFFFYADGRNFDSFIAILGMFGSVNNHFRIRISNLKQSMGVLVALLSNFVYIIVLVAGYVPLGSLTGSTLYLIISAVLTAVIAALFRIWLKRRGVQVFEAL